jgi:Peptidase family M48
MRIAALIVLAAIAGCDDNRFFRGARNLVNKPVAVPDMKEPSLAAAARVDQMGRQILSANIFCGADTSFQTIGNREPLLFHRGQESVFISDSLVDKCKTDEELAAVLCHELGRMIAEKRNAARMGYAEPLANITQTNNGEMGGITGDQFRLAELAAIEKRTPKKTVDRILAETTDPRKIAIDLLKTTGFDESHYKSSESLLRGLNKNRDVIQQLDGGDRKPEWTN